MTPRLLPAALVQALILALAAAPAVPQIILSEALADPVAMADAQGEFVELGNAGAEPAAPESLVLAVDGRILRLGRIVLEPGGVFLICRDSAAYALAGVRCDRGWSALSLPNSRPLEAEATGTGGGFRVTLPASRPGISWENTWDPAAGYLDFLPSSAGTGDSATPGARNSRSVRPSLRDLAIASVAFAGDRVRVAVEDRGIAPPDPARVFLRLDADWDGTVEETLDSADLGLSAGFPAVVEFAARGRRGRVEASLSSDGNPGNDRLGAAMEAEGGPLAFGAFQAAPLGGEPEWIEIRNVTPEPAPPGRRVCLAAAEAGGMTFGAGAGWLGPGERIFLAADTAAFRARFGPIKARILRPERWRALRNTGDTLALVLSGIPVDTLAWEEGEAGGGPPGAAGPPSVAHGWELSGRAASAASPLEVEVRAPAGSAYALRAFDLEGNRVRTIGGGGPGARRHAWDGSGEGGRRLPFGPYVISLAFDRGPAYKRAVLAGER